MKTMSKQITTAALLALGIGFSGAASAQSTWDLSTSSCDPYGAPPGAAGCTVNGVTATVTAWGNSGSAGQFVAATISDQGTSGVGITSSYGGKTEYTSDGLNHAIDNKGGTRNSTTTSWGAYTELLMVGFSEDTKLDGLSIGWKSGDADISVLRWTGEDPPDLTKMTATGNGGLIAKGWELVSSYDLDTTNSATVTGGDYSSWWLISAYFGSPSSSGTTELDTGDDFFKLKTFSGTGCKTTDSCGGGGGSVPEPGTLALAGLALAGIVGAKRRRARTV